MISSTPIRTLLKDVTNSPFSTPRSKRKLEEPVRNQVVLETAPCAQDVSLAFVPGKYPYFWECPNCNMIPLSKRCKHSVVYFGHSKPPTAKEQPIIALHFQHCLSRPMQLRSQNTAAVESREQDDVENCSMEKNFKKNVQSKDSFDVENVLNTLMISQALAAASASSTLPTFVLPQKDRAQTAVIDILLAAQLSKCVYAAAADYNYRKRSHELPEGFPGIQCQYCFPDDMDDPKYHQNSHARNGRWFCRNSEQLANTMSKIHHHLNNCFHCPPNIKKLLHMAKNHEGDERKALEIRLGHKATRSQYCATLFQRLTTDEN